MLAPGGPWSGLATPQLLPRRARKSRSARVRRETGNTAVPVPPWAAVQAAPFPARVVRVVVARLPFFKNLKLLTNQLPHSRSGFRLRAQTPAKRLNITSLPIHAR